MRLLKIAYIDYSINTRSLDIFTVGCNGSCKGCFNQELKDWNSDGLSLEESVFKIRELYNKFERLIDKFIIVGGDPIDAEIETDGAISVLIDDIKEFSSKPVFVFTRHDLSDIPSNILKRADYIKCGAYKPELTTDDNIQYDIKLATSNQKIFKKGLNYD